MSFLTDVDIITKDTWCRPLEATWAGGWDDSFLTESYGGPINNFKWVQVKYVLGPVWWDRPLQEVRKDYETSGLRFSYEFASDVPENSKLDINPEWEAILKIREEAVLRR